MNKRKLYVKPMEQNKTISSDKQYKYKILLKKIYAIINANDYIGMKQIQLTEDFYCLTSTQEKYILNKIASFSSYWTNYIFRCPQQWKKLNNDVKLLYKSLRLMCCSISHITNQKDKAYFKKYFLKTLSHNRSRIGDELYNSLINY